MRLCIRCQMELPLTAFSAHRLGRDGLSGACKACEVERQQVRKHNLTTLERELIANGQGGCRICKRPDPSAKGWVVDHDRKCCPGDRSCEKCRRGVLCHWCNTAIGYAMDSPELLREMARYLERGTAQWTESVNRVPRLRPTDETDGQNEESNPVVDHADVLYATPGKERFTKGDLSPHEPTLALSRPLEEGMTP